MPDAPSLKEFTLYFLRLGAVGFGGPIALAGYMQKDLVEDRKWISPAEYKEGLALAQLTPGPLAAQLAIYLRWVRAGVLAATLVAVAFVVPSFLMVLAIAAPYVELGGLPWTQGMFYGIGRGRHCDHRSKRLQALQIYAGEGLAALVHLCRLRRRHGMDGIEVIWLFLLSGVVAIGCPAACISNAKSRYSALHKRTRRRRPPCAS